MLNFERFFYKYNSHSDDCCHCNCYDKLCRFICVLRHRAELQCISDDASDTAVSYVNENAELSDSKSCFECIPAFHNKQKNYRADKCEHDVTVVGEG